MPTVEYDTIIIGAGVGGLTAAAKLVKSGHRVIVLEKNAHPGGTAYVYARKGFIFPMGPLGFSNHKIVSNILRDSGCEKELSYKRVHYRLRAYGFDIPLSLPFTEVAEELAKHFPAESSAINQFFRTVNKYESICRLDSVGSNHITTGEITQISAQQYLMGVIRDFRLRRILGSLGTSEPYSSLMMLAAMWCLMSKEGIWYPEGGLKAFCDYLVSAVTGNKTIDASEQKGVEQVRDREPTGLIKLKTEVKRILVDKGRIRGVELAEGSALYSESLISNADYKTTFLNLLAQDDLPPEWYRAIKQARQTGSVFQICLGIGEDRCDLSAFNYAGRLIYRKCDDEQIKDKVVDWNATEVDPEALAGQELEVSLLGRDDNKLVPPGGTVIVIRTEAPYSHFSRFRLGKGKRIADYQHYKNELALALIGEVECTIPGLGQAIRIMDTATPLTFHDQGGRSEGAVAGWSWDFSDFKDIEPRELILTPIKGLYMAGYQAFSALFMGGVPTAMESGYRAAQAVLNRAEPAREILLPASR